MVSPKERASSVRRMLPLLRTLLLEKFLGSFCQCQTRCHLKNCNRLLKCFHLTLHAY